MKSTKSKEAWDKCHLLNQNPSFSLNCPTERYNLNYYGKWRISRMKEDYNALCN